jgi:nicotinamidase-related amidase
MTTLTDRPRTALLVIDVQTGVVTGNHDRDGVVARIAGLVERARAAGTPVVWVQHSSQHLPIDGPGWEFVPELHRRDDEALVHKVHGDAFEATDLEDVLAAAGVGKLVVTGAQSDACIRSTIHGGFVRGYDVTLVGDAHTTEDLTEYGAPPPAQVVAHTNLYWGFQSGPGREADVVAAEEVAFPG